MSQSWIGFAPWVNFWRFAYDPETIPLIVPNLRKCWKIQDVYWFIATWIDWRFTSEDARIKLKRLYPSINNWQNTRYYISNLKETASSFYQRIRGYWGVENKVHYVWDMTFGEDKSRIRILPLPQIFAIARNLAINLYRNAGFSNMAQARRRCQFDLDHVLSLFKWNDPEDLGNNST